MMATDSNPLRTAIRQLSDNLTALRDFVDLVGPVLSERAAAQVRENSAALAPILVAFRELGMAAPEETEALAQVASVNGKVEVEKREDGTAEARITIPAPNVPAFRQAIRGWSKQHHQQRLLYESALMSLLSAAEWFLAQLLSSHFKQEPGSAGLKEKVFSFDDLSRFGSIDDARNYLLESRIEDVLRGSVESWLEYLRSKLGLSMGYIKDDEKQLIEVAQRRNLVVHNGGVVNRIYLSKVPETLRPDIKAGDQISVDRTYLDSAIDLVERAFVLIGAELWKSAAPNDEERGNLLIKIGYEHLLHERWRVGEALSYFLRNDKKLPESLQLSGTLNFWQALKWQGKFEEIRADVENADFSAKEEIYRLAHLALLDRYDEFFRLLPRVLESKSLSHDDLKTWPIFRAVRDTAQYATFVAESTESSSSPLPAETADA